MFSVKEVSVSYGDLQVLNAISFSVGEAEIVALLGANGAGKTTVINAISGINHVQKGKISFAGTYIHNTPPHSIVKQGIVQVPEGRRVFSTLSVMENLEMGSFVKRARMKRKKMLSQVFDLFPMLKSMREQKAGTLSGGQQQMLAIGRALMSLPKLLILDEPSLGLAPLVVKDIFEVIEKINNAGTPVLIVEQNIENTLQMADRAYVLENGSITMEGMGQELLHDPHIKEAYLGI